MVIIYTVDFIKWVCAVTVLEKIDNGRPLFYLGEDLRLRSVLLEGDHSNKRRSQNLYLKQMFSAPGSSLITLHDTVGFVLMLVIM